MIVGIDAVTQRNRKLIADLGKKYRLPTMSAARQYLDAGVLTAYGVSFPDLCYRAAVYVDKIFKGAKPGYLAVEQSTKF